jgi:hypothetical protein
MMFSRQALTILVLSGFALYAAAQCDDFKIEVTQQGLVLVEATPILTNDDVETLYHLQGGSYRGTVVPAESDKSLIFVHLDNATCIQHLVIVHDARSDGTGGRQKFFLDANMTDPTVDDGGTYTYQASKSRTKMVWNWGAWRTDGVAHPLDLQDGECLKLTQTPNFIQGITDFEFVSYAEDGTTLVYTQLNMTEDLELCFAEAEDPPEPEPIEPECADDFCPHWYNLICWLLWWFRCSLFGGGDE